METLQSLGSTSDAVARRCALGLPLVAKRPNRSGGPAW